MDVAKTLRDARIAAGLTQRQLAARAGVPQSTVARIERGQSMPRVDTFVSLLHKVDVQVAAVPVPDARVARGRIRELLRLTPAQRGRVATVLAKVDRREFRHRGPRKGSPVA